MVCYCVMVVMLLPVLVLSICLCCVMWAHFRLVSCCFSCLGGLFCDFFCLLWFGCCVAFVSVVGGAFVKVCWLLVCCLRVLGGLFYMVVW